MKDLKRILNDVFKGEARLDMINYSMITFIPKKEHVKCIREYRPTALLNRTLKIIAKILVNYLAPILQEMIGDYQIGFITARNILKGVATAYEVIHHCKKLGQELLKLDFENEYDMIDWDCLLGVLHLVALGKDEFHGLRSG